MPVVISVKLFCYGKHNVHTCKMDSFNHLKCNSVTLSTFSIVHSSPKHFINENGNPFPTKQSLSISFFPSSAPHKYWSVCVSMDLTCWYEYEIFNDFFRSPFTLKDWTSLW